eukprot:scaffold5981_cov141-Isochrysis_galbana.AAC.7
MPDRPYRADLPAHRLARSATSANSNWASLSAPGPGPPKRRAVPLFCPAMPTQLSSWPTRTLTRFRRPPAASSGSRPPPPPSRARQRGGRTAQRLRRANSANLRHCFFARCSTGELKYRGTVGPYRIPHTLYLVMIIPHWLGSIVPVPGALARWIQ